MREYSFPIAQHLTHGLAPLERMPRDATFLEDMTGLVPRAGFAEGPPTVTYPVTDARPYTWPSPQYMRGERGKYVGSIFGFFSETGGVLSQETAIEFDEMGYLSTVGAAGTSDGQYNTPKDAASWITGGFFYTAITDSGNNRVQILKNKVYYAKFGASGSGNGQFSSPCGLAVGSVSGTNRIFVVDTGNHRVQRFALDGTYETQWGTYGTGDTNLSSPTYCFVYGSEIYISDTANNRVVVYSLAGVYSRKWTVTNPLGLYVKDGEVFVVSGSALRVNVYNTTGTLLRYFSDQLVSPRDITFFGAMWRVTDGAQVKSYSENEKYRFAHAFSSPMGIHAGTDGRLWIIREFNHYMSIYTSITGPNGVWQLATFQDAYYATSGGTFYFHHGQEDADVGMSVTTTVRTLCAHDGRLLLGGLGGAWFSTARWLDIMEVWRETLPVDVRANIDLAWGDHWVVWGARGGGASDFPDYLLMAMIGCYGEGGFDEVEELIWTAIENGEIGMCPVRNVTQLHILKPLGARVIAYGDNGISELVVASSPSPRYWEQSIVPYGVPGRGAVGGWNNEHVFVGCQGHLHRFPSNARDPRNLDYSWLLSDLTGAQIIVSHDLSEDCYWIADGDTCYVLTRQGLGGPVDAMPTGVFRDATNGLCGYTYDAATTGSISVLTCPIDFTERGTKQATAVQIRADGIESMTAEVKWRMCDADAYKTGRVAPANASSVAFPRQSFADGKLEITGDVIVDVTGVAPNTVSTPRTPVLHGIELRYQAEDRRFIRGTKSSQSYELSPEETNPV